MVFPHRNQRSNPHVMPHDPMRQMMRPQPQNQSGNFGIQQFIQRLINPSQAGGQLSQSGASGLSNTLNNVQQVLKVIQTAAPIVQEYGPMVKNLPAMYRMVKAMQDVQGEEDEQSQQEQADNQQRASTKGKVKTDRDKQAKSNTSSSIGEKQDRFQGQSTPKLYI